MNYLIPRTLPLRSQPILRPAIQTQLISNLSRNPFLSTVQTASLSVKPSPAPPKANPNKIPAYLRPLSRPPTPPPKKSAEQLASLSYIVRRTPSIQLPVYRKWKSGGTRQVVLIKKVDGDRRKLLEELVEALSVAREDIRINPITQHIELKGDYFDKTRGWLLERGF